MLRSLSAGPLDEGVGCLRELFTVLKVLAVLALLETLMVSSSMSSSYTAGVGRTARPNALVAVPVLVPLFRLTTLLLPVPRAAPWSTPSLARASSTSARFRPSEARDSCDSNVVILPRKRSISAFD